MLNIISIIIGLIGAVLAVIGLVPLLGWTNWIWLIVPVIGAVLGQLSSSDKGRNLNLIVLAIMAVRLMIGGGVI
ncbi:hypothetical protein [Sphingomicrobium clamense]|uniref:Uncharacterized protein n=1 Tax=Sphingomicrobium clamense TaxID=2851013 RepID=A0ABS6V848_9SPHN|nr:hypothetical protein [Sphingomicrobium sp. B8]MBW0145754.1 hypothetical protein [Sphingomicrobium sp. B8]